MKKFKVTLLVPQHQVIEAPDLQEAHNQVTTMMQSQSDPEANPRPKVHSIIEVAEFGPSPAE